MQHVRERRVLCARKGASNVRRSEQRGSKCALQSHAQEATPPSRRSQGGRRALGSEAHELSDEAKCLFTPTPSNFAGEDTQSLRPRP